MRKLLFAVGALTLLAGCTAQASISTTGNAASSIPRSQTPVASPQPTPETVQASLVSSSTASRTLPEPSPKTAAPSNVSVPTAQASNYYAGQAVGGQSINVDLNSISRTSENSVSFTYYLGQEPVQSQANCEAGNWTTFPEGVVHRPQSQATQNMLNEVCSRTTSSTSKAGVAVVFDPPSNVRTAPNGDIVCSVRTSTTINIYGSTGSWYYTDVCGRMGVIDSSQIRF